MNRNTPRTDDGAAGGRPDRDGWLTLALVALVWVAFSPAIDNGWVAWDDDQNFLLNPHYRAGGRSGLVWAWTTDRLGVYQPLAWMLYEAEYAVGGLSPTVYHLTSVVLHAANAALLYAVVVSLVARSPSVGPVAGGRAFRASAALAVAVFAVHPLRAEVVAWVSCQPYLLCSLFLLAAVLAYLEAQAADESSRKVWMVVSLAAFAAALLSKAPAMVLPAVFVVLDVYPLRRLGGRPASWVGPEARRVWKEKLPFVALSLVFAVIAVRARTNFVGPHPETANAAWWRLDFACYTVVFYLAETIVPSGLSAINVMPADPTRPLLSLLLVAGAGLVLVRVRRLWPGLVAACVVFLVALVPYLGSILKAGVPILGDRYTYIGSAAFLPPLAYGLSRLSLRGGRLAAVALCALGAGVLSLLVPATRSQCRTWRSSEALWTQVVTYGGANSVQAHVNLGDALIESGRTADAIRSYRKAYELAGQYLSEHPREPFSQSLTGLILDHLARALTEAHRPEEAADAYREAILWQQKALRGDPGPKRFRMRLSDHFANLGRLQAVMGQPEEAIGSLEESLAVRTRLARELPGEEQALDIVRHTEAELRSLRGSPAERDQARHGDEAAAP